MGFIYKITNSINGKIYIGQTRRTIDERWQQHKSCASCKNLGYKSKLYDAMRKYGVAAFKIEEVEQCFDEFLDERETHWIRFYDAINSGYNIAIGGRGHISECKQIVQFDLDGNYIQTFASISEIVSLFNVKPQCIYSACNGAKRQSAGYQWRFLEDAEKCSMKLTAIKPVPKVKEVHQYAMSGEYVASYKSISSAVAKFGFHGTGGIRRACIGEIRWAYGYRWSYEKVDKLPDIRDDGSNQKIVQIDFNGNVIAVYDKMIDASKAVGKSQSAIWSVCNGRYSQTAGFKWEYYDDYVKEKSA